MASISNGRAQAQPRLFPAVVLSAALATLAFPPVDLGFLAWVALAPLLWALPRARGALRAFGLGYLFGLIHWGALTPWIGVTVVRWAETPLGWLAWVGLNLIESGWFGLFGVLAWWVGRRGAGVCRAISLAALWALVEWLRTQGGLAMPWSLLGYSQHAYLPLIQVADLGGFLLVSFTLALLGASLAEAWARRGAPGAHRPIAVTCIWTAACVAYGLWRLSGNYAGPLQPVVGVQPNITSERAEPRDPSAELEALRSLAARVPHQAQGPSAGPGAAPIMVWPESAAPVDAIAEQTDREVFGAIARSMGAWQLVGTPFHDENGRPHNSAALFAPDGTLAGRYDKQWLVPYGEWMPGRSWMPFGNVFHFVEHDVVPGTSDDPLPAGRARISPLICYESVFPQLARRRAAAGADMLIVVTNDSWAGRSAELAQHIEMTTLRAVETRRWIAVSATTGITALISPTGRVTSLPPYAQGFLRGNVALLAGLTPFVRWGDWFVLLCVLWLLGAAACARRQRGGNGFESLAVMASETGG